MEWRYFKTYLSNDPYTIIDVISYCRQCWMSAVLDLQVEQERDAGISMERHTECRDIAKDLGPRQSSCQVSRRIFSV